MQVEREGGEELGRILKLLSVTCSQDSGKDAIPETWKPPAEAESEEVPSGDPHCPESGQVEDHQLRLTAHASAHHSGS